MNLNGDYYPERLEYNEKEYWSYQRKNYKQKLEKHQIEHITRYMGVLRRQIMYIKFLQEQQIPQNIRLIDEGLEILKKHGINLPNWPNDYKEAKS